MRFNAIVAVCENLGIGFKGELPWRLKAELKFFSRETRRVRDATKRNAVIMGRRTYFSVPEDRRPLIGRLNIVLSTTLKSTDLPPEVLCFASLEEAMKHLEQSEVGDRIENVWVIGGSGVFKEAMSSKRCHRLYITEILKRYECDTFFPDIPADFKEESHPETPTGIQEENGIRYQYKVLVKC